MMFTSSFKSSLVCSQSFSQLRHFGKLFKHYKGTFSPSQVPYLEIPCVALSGKRKLKKAFQRHYSNRKQLDWELTKFNSVILDLSSSLDLSTDRHGFLLNLDGKPFGILYFVILIYCYFILTVFHLLLLFFVCLCLFSSIFQNMVRSM